MRGKVIRLKKLLLGSGVASVAMTWSVTAYWTLVSTGYVDTPWVI